MVHCILDHALAARRNTGIPYAVIENALPANYYAQLDASFPSAEEVAGTSDLPSNKVFRRSAADLIDDPRVPEIWREFIAYHCAAAFFERICAFWESEVERFHPGLADNFGKPLEAFTAGLRQPGGEVNPANRRHDIAIDCQFSINSPVRIPSTVRGPHLDRPFKLFAALLYFRHPADDSIGGDLEFYRLKPGGRVRPRPAKIARDNVEPVDHIRYAANTLVTFLNTAVCIHGVTPRAVTGFPRRYINFLGECYGGRSVDGFFTLPDPWPNRMALRAQRLWRRYVAAEGTSRGRRRTCAVPTDEGPVEPTPPTT